MNEPLPGPEAAQAIVSANLTATTEKDDPLVNTWFKRIEEAKKHWSRFPPAGRAQPHSGARHR